MAEATRVLTDARNLYYRAHSHEGRNMADSTLDQQIAHIEAQLDTRDTKAEVASLKADLHQAIDAQTWRLIPG